MGTMRLVVDVRDHGVPAEVGADRLAELLADRGNRLWLVLSDPGAPRRSSSRFSPRSRKPAPPAPGPPRRRGTEAFASAMQEVAASAEEQNASTQQIVATATALAAAAERLAGQARTFRLE